MGKGTVFTVALHTKLASAEETSPTLNDADGTSYTCKALGQVLIKA